MTEKFLDFAEFLQNQDYFSDQGKEFIETTQKVTISRAYYGLFHIAKNFANRFSSLVLGKGFDDDTEAIHGKLRQFYLHTSMNLKPDLPEKLYFNSVATALDELRTFRNICDYNKPVSFNLEKRTNQLLNTAKKTRDDINKLNIWLDSLKEEGSK